jgi:hypothetical protein
MDLKRKKHKSYVFDKGDALNFSFCVRHKATDTQLSKRDDRKKWQQHQIYGKPLDVATNHQIYRAESKEHSIACKRRCKNYSNPSKVVSPPGKKTNGSCRLSGREVIKEQQISFDRVQCWRSLKWARRRKSQALKWSVKLGSLTWSVFKEFIVLIAGWFRCDMRRCLIGFFCFLGFCAVAFKGAVSLNLYLKNFSMFLPNDSAKALVC